MIHNRRSLLFWIILVALVSITIPVQASSYKSVLHRWTRSDRVYNPANLNATLLWSATLLTAEMSEAQENLYTKLYDTKDLASAPIKRADGEVLFFVSFYAEDHHHDDLTRKDDGWELRLESGDRSLAPLRIEKIDKPKPLDHRFYPYLELWSHGYYVWFPKAAASLSKPWILSVHGPFSHSNLVWKK